MRYVDAIDRLATALTRPLPGAAAHERMLPRPRRDWPPGFDPADRRDAAGLVLLFPDDDQTYVVVTVRTAHVRHAGQVSLPGGVIEPGESPTLAALREAHEEIGLATEGVRILGALTPLDIPVSGFRLHPIVGCIDVRPRMHPSDHEVAAIVDIPLSQFWSASALGTERMLRDARTVDAPVFRVGGIVIWGATAMVLAELLVLLGWSA